MTWSCFMLFGISILYVVTLFKIKNFISFTILMDKFLPGIYQFSVKPPYLKHKYEGTADEFLQISINQGGSLEQKSIDTNLSRRSILFSAECAKEILSNVVINSILAVLRNKNKNSISLVKLRVPSLSRRSILIPKSNKWSGNRRSRSKNVLDYL